jgi:hypothetical protein
MWSFLVCVASAPDCHPKYRVHLEIAGACLGLVLTWISYWGSPVGAIFWFEPQYAMGV